MKYRCLISSPDDFPRSRREKRRNAANYPSNNLFSVSREVSIWRRGEEGWWNSGLAINHGIFRFPFISGTLAVTSGSPTAINIPININLRLSKARRRESRVTETRRQKNGRGEGEKNLVCRGRISYWPQLGIGRSKNSWWTGFLLGVNHPPVGTGVRILALFFRHFVVSSNIFALRIIFATNPIFILPSLWFFRNIFSSSSMR